MRRADALYAGAKSRLTLERATKLGRRHVLQPNAYSLGCDGIYAGYGLGMDCCKDASARGLKRCGGCKRWLVDRTGLPQSTRDPRDRFAEKWMPVPHVGCWLWLDPGEHNGYGRLWLNGRYEMAHRLSYEWHVGPIPEGFQIDHLCRNRWCVNPGHLEPVTIGQNLHRSPETKASRNAAKTHCIRGHEFTPENTGRKSNGGRACRACARLYASRRRKASRGAA